MPNQLKLFGTNQYYTVVVRVCLHLECVMQHRLEQTEKLFSLKVASMWSAALHCEDLQDVLLLQREGATPPAFARDRLTMTFVTRRLH